jgi:hypothetical protein
MLFFIRYAEVFIGNQSIHSQSAEISGLTDFSKKGIWFMDSLLS